MPMEYYSPVSGGAISSVICQRAKTLIARGHRVSIVGIANDDPIYQTGNFVPLKMPERDSLRKYQRAASHFQNKILQWEWPFYGFYVRAMMNALADLSPAPDVVITHNDVIAARFVKKALPSTPVVAWLHNEIYRPPRDMQKSIASTQRFGAVSDYIRNWTSATYPGLSEKIQTIHNGVDVETFFPRPDFLRDCEPLRVAMAGRIDPNKGGDLVAQAVIDLKREGLPIQLVVAGGVWFYGNETQEKDPYFQRLKSLLDAAGAEYLGHIAHSEMPAFYRSCDVACVPSRVEEPFGLVALEAMACGSAVVAARRGGLPEFCDGAAMMIDAEQPGSVTKALRELISNKEKLRSLKRAGVVRAAEYSWEIIGERLEKLLTSI